MANRGCESPSISGDIDDNLPDYNNLVEKLVENLQEFPAIWKGRCSSRSKIVTHVETQEAWENLATFLGVSVKTARRLYDTLRRRFREASANHNHGMIIDQ